MNVKVVKETEVSGERIADVMVGAFECNGLVASIFDVKDSKPPSNDSDVPDSYKETFYECLFGDGFIDIVESENESNEVMRLDFESIKRGLNVMANVLPKHFDDLVNENDDAITSTEFLQCCLYPEYVTKNKQTVWG